MKTPSQQTALRPIGTLPFNEAFPNEQAQIVLLLNQVCGSTGKTWHRVYVWGGDNHESIERDFTAAEEARAVELFRQVLALPRLTPIALQKLGFAWS